MLQEILQMLEALGIFLAALALLLVTFPFWIGPFIAWQRAPFLPDSAID